MVYEGVIAVYIFIFITCAHMGNKTASKGKVNITLKSSKSSDFSTKKVVLSFTVTVVAIFVFVSRFQMGEQITFSRGRVNTVFH